MSGYHPSVFLLCTLIFWTGISAITEMIIPFDAILFAITTYAPTLHFATQAIVRRSVGGVQALDTRKASRRAGLLTVSWVLNVGIHVGLWWVDSREALAEIFLLPTLPGSQVILVMMFIVFRYAIDNYMMGREQCLRVARGSEEATLVEAAALLQANGPARSDESVFPHQEDSESAIETAASTSASPPAVVPLYQPSIPLLLISISLLLCTLVLGFQDHSEHSTLILAIVASIQTYIPTLLLHSYIILQILRRDIADALQASTVIAGLSFDLIPLWLGTRGFMEYMQFSRSDGVFVDPIRMVPGGVEVLLAVYFAVRYTRSVYAERKSRIEMGIMDGDLGEPTDNLELPSSATQPTVGPLGEPESETYYHPSPILLVISVILSTSCLVIESLAEPVCGVPMSAIVYAPTILLHLHLIYQQYRRPNPSPSTTPIQKFSKSMERSMQLCLVWLLTQAFYVFVWPLSPHLERKVMNPWVRWSEVVLVVYLAVRYVGDRELRNSGAIRLPPDTEQGNDPTIGPSSAVILIL
ncbi:hypothetical protein BJ912DRAFT_477937 [Pholiota molesta]|nr:hypothetical protein BJ912DRAFT_477937 [Pholiota molesta]